VGSPRRRAPVQGRRSSRQVGQHRGGDAIERSTCFAPGYDWATESHQVCMLDATGKPIAERTVPHSGSGISQFLLWLTQLEVPEPACVGVAIEVPRGAIVESLVERGYAVFSINPKQLDRFRDRHSVAGAKDDRRDAFVLADSLRTDPHCFQRIKIDDPLTIRIRELSRLEDELQQDWSRLTNQLREQLHRYYPQMLHLSPAADDPWLWELIELAPLPEQAADLNRRRVETLLRRHHIRRHSADQVLSTLKTTPLPLAPGAAEAASEHALLLLARLRVLHQPKVQVANRIDSVLDQLAASTQTGVGPKAETKR